MSRSQDEFPNGQRDPQVARTKWLRTAIIGIVLALLLAGALLPVSSIDRIPYRQASAQSTVNNLVMALRFYLAEYGALPSGTHPEIMRALLGNNPHKVIFFDASPKQYNASGELLDPWKTPYRIDTSNPAHLKVYSFGPNRHDDDCSPQSDDVGPPP